MKRWLSTIFIGTYMSLIVTGIFCQTMSFCTDRHPLMYFIVWDMFCGWSPYETRYYVIGEGESGTYYELAPGPWTQFMPYGDLVRSHYDVLGNAQYKMALNALKRADHEPIHRIVMIEELWNKKYNLSDAAWNDRFDEPKDPKSYYWQRAEMLTDGSVTQAVPDYLSFLKSKSVADNPRLMIDVHRNRDQFILSSNSRSSE